MKPQSQPPVPASTVIEIEDLWHTYMLGTPFEHPALRGVTLRVHDGEVVGIIGQTGSGKSTLVQYFNGLMRPTRGRVIVAGHDLGSPRADVAAVRRAVGLAFQEPETQVFERLVGDDVAYGPRRLRLPFHEIRERVRWAMEAPCSTTARSRHPDLRATSSAMPPVWPRPASRRPRRRRSCSACGSAATRCGRP